MKKAIKINYFSYTKKPSVIYDSISNGAIGENVNVSRLSEALHNPHISLESIGIEEIVFLDPNNKLQTSVNARSISCIDFDTGELISVHESIQSAIVFYRNISRSSFTKCLAGSQEKIILKHPFKGRRMIVVYN